MEKSHRKRSDGAIQDALNKTRPKKFAGIGSLV
jgi:hypothetical protein